MAKNIPPVKCKWKPGFNKLLSIVMEDYIEKNSALSNVVTETDLDHAKKLSEKIKKYGREHKDPENGTYETCFMYEYEAAETIRLLLLVILYLLICLKQQVKFKDKLTNAISKCLEMLNSIIKQTI